MNPQASHTKTIPDEVTSPKCPNMATSIAISTVTLNPKPQTLGFISTMNLQVSSLTRLPGGTLGLFLGLRVPRLVQGLGFRVQGLGLRVWATKPPCQKEWMSVGRRTQGMDRERDGEQHRTV